jgi:hypothetical protein
MSAAVVESSGVMEPAICGAAKRQGQGVCQKQAGWGTDHLGFGRCRLHGGNTTAHRTHHLRLVESLVPAAIAELQRLVFDSSVSDAVKLRSVQDVLDRAGVGERKERDAQPVDVRVSVLVERVRALREGTVIDTTASEDGDG